MPWSIWLLIIILLLLCLFLWFLKVWRTMQDRRRTLDLAAMQMKIFQTMTNELKDEAVLTRSVDIYNQAVRLYQLALENPLNWLPAKLMGFHPVAEGSATQAIENN